MKNGLLRDLVILICPKRNFWQPLSTQIFSRVLWCAEIAAVLTFWAFRGKSIHARVWKWPWPWGNPQLKITVHCLKYLRFYNHVWSNDLNTHTFWQHHFDSTRISQNHTWQSAAGWFLFSIKSCVFFLPSVFAITLHVVSSRWRYTPPVNQHGIWRSVTGKGHLFWKLSFPASMLDFGGVSSVH